MMIAFAWKKKIIAYYNPRNLEISCMIMVIIAWILKDEHDDCVLGILNVVKMESPPSFPPPYFLNFRKKNVQIFKLNCLKKY